jgi:hypothetical protein
VVDVTHHGDDRRTRAQQRLVVVVAVVEQRLQLDFLLLTGIDQEQLGAELEREQLHVLVAERHGRGDHLAVLQQELDDVGRGAVELRPELLGRHATLDDDGALGHRGVVRGVALRLRLQLVAVATTTTLAAVRWAALSARATTGTATRTTGTATGTTGATTGAAAVAGATAGTTTGAAGATGVAAGATTGGRTTAARAQPGAPNRAAAG